MANRYDDLVSALPKGSFYDAVGNIIPYRGNSPYEFLFTPVPALRTFGIYVNGQFRGEVTADVDGNAIVRVILEQGRQDIVLIDTSSGSQFPAYVDVRVIGTVMAAHADVLEGIDASVDEIQASLSLSTVTSRFIEDVYGRPVQQPNDLGGWLNDSYRKLLRRLRQAFRVYGAKLLGLRQTVHAFTSSLPLRVPRAWRPVWVLGYQLAPNGDLSEHARMSISPLTTLNLSTPGRAEEFVHVAFGPTLATLFPGPFNAPPVPQLLQVTFSAGWDGGTVVVNGVDAYGNAITDSFTPTAPPETAVGARQFATIGSATKSANAVGSASIGVAESRFVRVLSYGGYNGVGIQVLRYFPSPDRMQWVTGTHVPIPSSGTYELRTADLPAVWYGLVFEPGGGYVVGANDRFLALEGDGLGLVVVDLTDTFFGGGASPRTAAQVATSVNTYFGRDLRYGAVHATGSIGCVSGAAIAAADPFDFGTVTITLDDGPNPAVVFEFRIALPVTPGNILVSYTVGDSATTIATKLALAINGVGLTLRITAGTSGSTVLLTNEFGGTVGNVAITSTLGSFVLSGMSGGANSGYAGIASSSASLNALGNVVRFAMPGSVLGPSSSFRVHPWGADAAPVVLGLPRYRTLLSVGAARRAVVLDVPVARLPDLFETIILHAAFAETVSIVTSGFATPTRPAAVEFVCDPAWHDGSSLQVMGVAFGTGALVSETLTVDGGPVIATGDGTGGGGGAASSGDGINVVATLTGTFAGAREGMFFRRLFAPTVGAVPADAGSFIERVFSDTSIRLETTLGGLFAGGFEIRDAPAPVQGLQLFAELTQIVNVSPAAAPPVGPSGTTTLSVLDGAARGFDVVVGRNVRDFGVGSATINLAPLDASGVLAGFEDTNPAPAFVAEVSDLQGWLLISGSTASGGTNNGLHRIYDTAAPGLAGLFIRHQDADRGGHFVLESPVPVGVSWRIYNHGEVVTVVAKDAGTGDLTLFPPGLRLARVTGDQVELDEELVFEQPGELGPGTVTVSVDKTMLPTALAADAVTLEGVQVPDGWRAYNQQFSFQDTPGFFVGRRLELGGTSTDVDGIGAKQALERPLRPVDVVTYRGFVIRASFWVQQHTDASEGVHVAFSVNGGGFVPGPTVLVVGTHLVAGGSGGTLDPVLVQADFELPYDAATCVVRLVHEGTPVVAPVAYLSVEKCTVVALPAGSLFMGDNTLLLNEQQAKFGELLYLWSPEVLGTEERGALGVPVAPASFPLVPGQIDRVVNAHGYWERFDVTEGPYTGTPSLPMNLKGTYEETNWMAATLTNMAVTVGTPPRTTVVAPSSVSLVVGEALTFVAPSNAALAEVSAHDDGPFPAESYPEELLLEDGLPVPATPSVTGGVLPWRFIAPLGDSRMQIASVAAGDPGAQAVYNGASNYTLSYRRMIRAEPTAFDLGVSFGDYLWLVDAAIYRRAEPSSTPFTRTQQLVFLTNLRAPLAVRSDQQATTSMLVKDTGLAQTPVAASNWSYVDGATVEIDSGVFDPNAIYTLTYQALEPQYVRPATVVVETRSSSVSLSDVLSATWRTVVVDEPVNRLHRYHQLRVTLSGVVDVRDVEIAGLGLRGIHLYGAAPYAPGIIL